jgi:glyoxylate reductase
MDARSPKRIRIVVTQSIPLEALGLLREQADVWVSPHDRPLEPSELHKAIAGSDGVVTLLHDLVDSAFLGAAGPQLRVVSNIAVGYDNIDVRACTDRGVVVTNTPDVLTDATADLALALILMSTRRLGEGERLVRSGAGWGWSLDFMLGTGIQRKTLGIVGLGRIGAAVARRANAFGMEIVYTGPRQVGPALEQELACRFVSLDELLQNADVVSLHCPLNAETRGLIGSAELQKMKATAFLVNTTRGAVVDESALAEALTNGTISGAGLDVFEREPHVHPGLLELDNVVLLPHLGSATVETRTSMAVLAAKNAIAVTHGRPPLSPVRART